MYSLEKRYIRKDGLCVWVHLTLALARDSTGKPLYRIAIVENIGERKKMVASLLQSADYFSKTFHDNTAAMCISRVVDGRFVDVNSSFLCLVNYHRDAVIGRTATELQLWTDSEDYSGVVPALQAHQALHNVELRFRTAAGAVRDGMVSRELIEFGGEQCILSTIYDITERKRVEAAVQEAKRLEGRLEGIILTAREMGHLLNNDLQIPLGTLELLLESDDIPAELRATADKAMSNLVAAKQHVLQLQQVVRVETKNTPIGPTLDLERSSKPDEDA
jgi:PAS domain S-box-containing protein